MRRNKKVLGRVNLHHLEYFYQVVTFGSITNAAKFIGTSQPSLSSQIKELEKDLGTQLFVKVGRNIKKTEAGNELFALIAPIFEDLEEVKKKLPAISGKERETPIKTIFIPEDGRYCDQHGREITFGEKIG